ncbi:uracil-DNA glycosylase [Aeoliella sp. ICT_H6.2]|uniref:Type-4 uracil-DNA glycosylase n=1 Tax=Aeoliella straminimaris TaxID=2954799 RepID=A0A9X2JH18_9BACT|nr:uracil-DNA glycosylase [Aeoliella straminimaris]
MSDIDPAKHRAVVARLESLQLAGVEQLPRGVAPAPAPSANPVAVEPSPPAEPVAQPALPATTSTTQAPMSPTAPAQEADTGGEKVSSAATLEVLQTEVAGCTLCDELASTRTQTVFGVGSPSARLCFMGEAPGADEDRTGIPFVGRAGQLLTKIIEACTLTRDEVYILNVLKCRPPGNRNPTPTESANCKQYLRRQLELIEPEYICCLGAVAAQNLLETTETIGRLRGRVHQYRGINVVCTYHPAYLLRNPSAKKDCWDDMKMLMGLMGVKL